MIQLTCATVAIPASDRSSRIESAPKTGWRRGHRWAVAAAWAFLTFWLLVPRPQTLVSCPAWLQPWLVNGYAIHFSVYVTLALLGLSLAQGRRWAVALCLLAVALHGIATETAQIGIPGRGWDPYDLACNLAGVACAGAVYGLTRLTARKLAAWV